MLPFNGKSVNGAEQKWLLLFAWSFRDYKQRIGCLHLFMQSGSHSELAVSVIVTEALLHKWKRQSFSAKAVCTNYQEVDENK